MPLLTANPTATIEQDTTGGELDYTLKCSWGVVESNSTLQYNVDWLIDNRIVATEVVPEQLDLDTQEAFMNRSLLTALPYGTKVEQHLHIFLSA